MLKTILSASTESACWWTAARKEIAITNVSHVRRVLAKNTVGTMASAENCAFPFVRLFPYLMKPSTKAKGETKSVPFDPIEPKANDAMDDTVADL